MIDEVQIETDNTKKYEWVKFLKSEKREDFEMLSERNPTIKKAYAEVIRLSEDEETQMLYEAREKALKDYNSGLKFAREEGKLEAKIETAINLLRMSIPIDQIAQATGLTVKDIEGLR